MRRGLLVVQVRLSHLRSQQYVGIVAQARMREMTLGIEQWEDRYRELQHSRYVDQYKALHGGTLPPGERYVLIPRR